MVVVVVAEARWVPLGRSEGLGEGAVRGHFLTGGERVCSGETWEWCSRWGTCVGDGMCADTRRPVARLESEELVLAGSETVQPKGGLRATVEPTVPSFASADTSRVRMDRQPQSLGSRVNTINTTCSSPSSSPCPVLPCQVEPNTKLFPAVFVLPTHQNVVQFELGKQKVRVQWRPGRGGRCGRSG